ncbi:LysE family transporter [Spongisporangium articulatum]|uniref:LysE family transporter n=1 Tax=Spongisporangium articulatum TaxID=3362603 RepID=A0ABW8APW8_9ACTN
MTDVGPALLAGLVAGLAVAMPLGAIGVLLLHEGMNRGWRPAAGGATGVALVDLTYAGVAVLIGTAVSRALSGWEHPIHLVGAGVLVLIALRGLLADLRRPEAPGDDGSPALVTGSPWRVMARFVALTAINPLTAVYFVALAAGLGDTLATREAGVAFVLAVFVASLAWQLTLAGFGALAGARLPAGARRATGVAGHLVVLAYAARLALMR